MLSFFLVFIIYVILLLQGSASDAISLSTLILLPSTNTLSESQSVNAICICLDDDPLKCNTADIRRANDSLTLSKAVKKAFG